MWGKVENPFTDYKAEHEELLIKYEELLIKYNKAIKKNTAEIWFFKYSSF